MKGKLSIIEQIRLIRDKFPDVWGIFMDGCPSEWGLPELPCWGRDNDPECSKCWDKALEDDK